MSRAGGCRAYRRSLRRREVREAIDAIRKATRPKCRPITDTHQMEGAQFVFGRGLQVCVLGRFGEVYLLCSNVDQHVLALMEPLEVGPVPFVYLAAGPGHIPRIEAHRRSPYHDPAVTLRDE